MKMITYQYLTSLTVYLSPLISVQSVALYRIININTSLTSIQMDQKFIQVIVLTI